MRPFIASLAALVSLGACSDNSNIGNFDELFQVERPRTFRAEAGAIVDSGHFGNATMNNTLVMNGERDFAIALAQRFAEEVPPTVNFDFNSSQLGPEARAILQQQADWMRQFPELRFSVYGHTDLVGSDGYNQSLGRARANAVVRYLGQLGISRSRLDALVSYGETRPLILTATRERANRRTVTEVSGWVTSHPGVLNGKYAEVIFREYVVSAEPRFQIETIQGADFGASQ